MADNRELALVLRLVADQFQQELRNSQGALGAFNTFLKDWRTQLVAVGTALFAVAKSTANYGEEMLKGAQKTGQTVQTFSALSHAAGMADVENQQFILGLKSLAQNMVEAQRQTGDGAAAFRRLGVSAVDSTGQLRPTEQVLLDLADVFARSADGAGKTEAAVKLFGKAGIDLIPFLNQGRSGITALMAEAQRLGLVLSEQDAEAANRFNDELKELDAQVKGLTVSVGLPLVRGLTDVVQMFQELEVSIQRAGEELAGFSKHLSENFGKTGVGQGLMDVFSAMGFGHRKGEAPGAAERALTEALGVKPGGPDRGPEAGRDVHMGVTKPAMPSAPPVIDQEKLGKAKLEIFLAANRAIEIHNKLMQEAAAGANEYFLAFDRQQQFQKEDEAAEERKGRMIVEQTQLQVQIREAAQQRERDGLIRNAQAWIDYDNQVGASTELRYDHQMELLEAMLAKETQLSQDSAARLLMAWQNNDAQLAEDILDRSQIFGQQRETLEIQTLTRLAAIHQQYSDNIFDGWRIGMQRYVQDTQSAFGIAADLARRTAQFMEQSFRTFFFDLFEGKIKTLKDLFKSFADFAKQIIAQVMAQLATMLVLKSITGGMGGGGLFGMFGGGGGGGFSTGLAQLFGGIGGRNVSGIDVGAMKFASGGTVLGAGNQDTVRALLAPGEGVLNRRGMAALDRLNAGITPVDREPSGATNITVNIVNSGRTDKPTVSYRRDVKNIVLDLIYRDPDVGQMIKGMA